MSDLIKRVKALVKRQALIEEPGFVDPDIQECIQVPSPVLPDEVAGMIDDLRNGDAYSWPDVNQIADLLEKLTRQHAAALQYATEYIERLERDCKHWKTAWKASAEHVKERVYEIDEKDLKIKSMQQRIDILQKEVADLTWQLEDCQDLLPPTP